jgi:hypothetical protein
VTDLTITAVGDATVRSARPALTDGSGQWVRVKSGEQRGYLRPQLGSIAGRTVLSATLVGRVGPGHVAQTYTVSPVTERWSPGRVTWSNQPAVNSGAAVTEAVSALADGGLVEVDITAIIQSVADGTEWFGLRISTNSTSTGQRFYSSDSGEPAWELLISLSDAPDVPTDLRPDGGAVKDGEPILAWMFTDLGGDSTEQAESWVQVDTPAAGVDPDEVTPDFDSGWVANVDPEFDLSTAAYTPPVLSANPTYWRVNVRDGDGNESGWSDWAEFTVSALPTLVVDSPTGAFGDPTPQLLAHLSSGTVTSWKAFVTGSDRSDVRAESGMSTGAVDWQIPFRRDGRRVLTAKKPGWIYLKVWDDVDRAVAVGQKAYLDVWIPADLTESGALTPTTNLTVTQYADGDPRHIWQWSRTEAADAWLLEVDGEEIARLDPEDVTVDAGIYTWTDSGEIPPLRERTLRVRAVEGTKKSGGARVDQAHTVSGVWLLPEDTDTALVLAGTAVEGFTRTDRVATYTPLKGPEVDVIYDTPPRSGTFEGVVDTTLDQDVWEVLDAIEELRKSSNRKARMVWGSQSARVRLRDPDATSHSEINAENLMHVVRFGFVEVD